MLIKNKSIAIIGGGPGGLSLARLLQLKGAKVKIYERDLNKYARVQGSPLDLHEGSGLAAIRKAGLLEEFKQNFLPGADKTLIMNEKAMISYSDHDKDMKESFGDEYFRPEIDRGSLRKILLDSLKPQTVVWDSHFLSMEKQNEGWKLNFKNKDSVYADLVIGSDGANSKVRPYITDVTPIYSGIIMLEGNIPHSETKVPIIDSLIDGGKIMAFGNEKNILMGQKGNGDLGFYISFKASENWSAESNLDFYNKSQVLEWFKVNFSEWSNIWHQLLENIEPPYIPRPIFYMPLDQNWESRPNLTIIGDAAHVMPPFAGEGANMAMLDALELSEHLTSESNSLDQAISDFEINMKMRASKATRESLENGEKMHSANALETMLQFFGAH